MVTYHRPNDFKLCIDSILKNTIGPYQLNIIDNSCGKLDPIFSDLPKDVRIHRTEKNVGKGAAIMQFYDKIAPRNQFISIDSDIIVPYAWDLTLLGAAMSLTKWACLAPVIKDSPTDSFKQQMITGKLRMHRMDGQFKQIKPNLYECRHLAGPLFLINTAFFNLAGGFNVTQLYGNDDGELMKAARREKYFTGLISNLEIIHLRGDEDMGYVAWKRRNINKNADDKGYWD